MPSPKTNHPPRKPTPRPPQRKERATQPLTDQQVRRLIERNRDALERLAKR